MESNLFSITLATALVNKCYFCKLETTLALWMGVHLCPSATGRPLAPPWRLIGDLLQWTTSLVTIQLHHSRLLQMEQKRKILWCARTLKLFLPSAGSCRYLLVFVVCRCSTQTNTILVTRKLCWSDWGRPPSWWHSQLSLLLFWWRLPKGKPNKWACWIMMILCSI